ncbi:MAG TPA: hypothetical protein VFW40_06795 [Capsulimonadaceae bacterium]|nr:hypothetical protein [Capsulimonadaceae bacterium]
MNETQNASKTWLGVGLAVLFIAVLVVIFIYRAQKPEPIPAPASYAKYTAMDNSFTCDQPQGWVTQSGASGGINSGVLFQRNSAKIDITTDLAGSLMGDITKAQNAQLGDMAPGMTGDLKSPVEKLHEQGAAGMKEKLSNYQELPYKKFDSGTGEACSSEYTGNGGLLVGKVHGYRVTMLSSERRVTIICQCPESSWEALKPTFRRVILSFQAMRG